MELPTYRSTMITRVPGVGVTFERAQVAVPRTPHAPESAEYRRSAASLVMSVFLVLDLFLLGANVLLGAMVGITAMFNSGEEAGGLGSIYDDPSLLWLNAFVVLVMMGLIPLAWVLASRREGLTGAVQYLGLHRFGRSLFVGTGLAGLMLSGSILVLLFFAFTGIPFSPGAVEDVPLPVGFGWPLVIMVSFAAGFGEEILFRGVLQRWTGWVGQAVLFAIAHLAGGEPLQVGVTLATGLVFGRLRALGWSLWTLITAHAVYDFCLLGMEIVTSG